MKFSLLALILISLLFVSCSNPEESAIEPIQEDDMVEVSFNLTGPEWKSVTDRPMMRLEQDSVWLYAFQVFAQFEQPVLHAAGVSLDFSEVKVRVNKKLNYEIRVTATRLIARDFDWDLLDPFNPQGEQGYNVINSFSDVTEFISYTSDAVNNSVGNNGNAFLYYDRPNWSPYYTDFIPQMDYFQGAKVFNAENVSEFDIDLLRGSFGFEVQVENLNDGNLEIIFITQRNDYRFKNWPTTGVLESHSRDFTLFALNEEQLTYERIFASFQSAEVTYPLGNNMFNSEIEFQLLIKYVAPNNESEIIYNGPLKLKRNTIRTFVLDMEDFLDGEEINSSYRLNFVDSEWNREEPVKLTPGS